MRHVPFQFITTFVLYYDCNKNSATAGKDNWFITTVKLYDRPRRNILVWKLSSYKHRRLHADGLKKHPPKPYFAYLNYQKHIRQKQFLHAEDLFITPWTWVVFLDLHDRQKDLTHFLLQWRKKISNKWKTVLLTQSIHFNIFKDKYFLKG